MSRTRHNEALISLDHARWCARQMEDVSGDEYYALFLSFFMQALEDTMFWDPSVLEAAYEECFG